MIPDFPQNIFIRISLAWLNFLFVALVSALNRVGCNKKNSTGPIFLYYEESLVSSNLDSNLLSFHCAHPKLPGSPERRCTTTLTNCDEKMVGNREDAEAQNSRLLQKFVKTQRHRLQRHKLRQPRLRRPRLETRCNNSSSNRPRWWKTRQNCQIFHQMSLISSTISRCRITNICFDFFETALACRKQQQKIDIQNSILTNLLTAKVKAFRFSTRAGLL